MGATYLLVDWGGGVPTFQVMGGWGTYLGRYSPIQGRYPLSKVVTPHQDRYRPIQARYILSKVIPPARVGTPIQGRYPPSKVCTPLARVGTPGDRAAQ